MPGPATAGSASSSSPGPACLLAPRAVDGRPKGNGPRPDTLTGLRTAADADLPEAVSLLVTPTAQLAVNGGSQHPDKRRAGGHGPTLADQAEHELLPTPTPVASYSQNTPENHLRKKPGRTVVTDLKIMVENGLTASGGALLPTPLPGLAAHLGAGQLVSGGGALLPTPLAGEVAHNWRDHHGANQSLRYTLADLAGAGPVTDWGRYSRAVLRWQQVLGRMVPHPLVPGSRGNAVLSPLLVEWMLGLPEGWVTAAACLSRNAQLKILGNGVVPQQGVLALLLLAERLPWNATS